MENFDTTLRFVVTEDDFKTNLPMIFYDGVNFSGSVFGNTLSQSYTNGDMYGRIYDKEDNKITKVTIKFYEKESNTTCYVEKDLDGNTVYKKDDSKNTSIISKKEYEEFAIKFIDRNNYSIKDLINKMGLEK